MANINISGTATQPVPAVFLQHDVQGVVTRALTAARASGRDYVGQTDAAVRAVTAVRPDLTMRQATLAVMWMRDHAAE